jgi:putative flippase GtrA
LRQKILHFGFIGAIAFFIDTATYFITGVIFLILLGHTIPFAQKTIGLTAGIFTTYLYNSRVTFCVSYSWNRFWLYLGSQLLGMSVNLTAFLILDSFLPVLIALAGATLVAAVVNFLGALLSLGPE